MKRYIVHEELLQGILNYLSIKPYAEVHVLIGEILKLNPIEGENDGKVDN